MNLTHPRVVQPAGVLLRCLFPRLAPAANVLSQRKVKTRIPLPREGSDRVNENIRKRREESPLTPPAPRLVFEVLERFFQSNLDEKTRRRDSIPSPNENLCSVNGIGVGAGARLVGSVIGKVWR